MATPRIYWPAPIQLGDTLTPEKKHSHHLLNVLRLKSDESVIIFGYGRAFQATLKMSGKKNVALYVENELDTDTESPIHIELAVCAYRGKQWDYGIQKAVELGVKSIQPIISHKTDVPTNKTAAEKRHAHNLLVIIAACEQSGRNQLPILKEEQTLQNYLNEDKKIVACDFFDATIHWTQIPTTDATVSVLVGPAGGFTAEESTNIQESGAECLRLGPRTLRSDTACVVALTLVQTHWGDLN